MHFTTTANTNTTTHKAPQPQEKDFVLGREWLITKLNKLVSNDVLFRVFGGKGCFCFVFHASRNVISLVSREAEPEEGEVVGEKDDRRTTMAVLMVSIE